MNLIWIEGINYMNEQLVGVKAIMFDLGNVVIDLHYDRALALLTRLTRKNPEYFGDLLVSSPILKKLEVGAISEEEFRSEFCEILNVELSDQEFDAVFNSFLGEISQVRVDCMLAIRQNFRTLILSNTNSIHVRSFDQTLRSSRGINEVSELVDTVYYSHLVGMRKPDEEIYEFVLNREGLKADEVLFIDDRQENVDAALKLGIRAVINEWTDDWMRIFS